MASGKVKWFNEKKGYGFITSDEGSDIFVHYSAISGEGYKLLVQDQRVEYELKEGPRGPQAYNVKKIDFATV